MNTLYLTEKFRTFAIKECAGSSNLYEYLSLMVAEDKELLALAANAGKGQPVPNLFFGAVHFLLLDGKVHPLRNFYQSLSEEPLPVEESYPYFKDFCQDYAAEIAEILKTKIVQTNEVRRCAYLYPVFSAIHRMGGKPLALVEIGTSAGLQLLWDQYSYTYGSGSIYGNQDSEVQIESEIKAGKPHIPLTSPPVATRIGIDLHINDLTKEEDFLWLKALIWPEHHERRMLFDQAAAYVKKQEITFIEGNGIEWLAKISGEIPEDQLLCIFHTHVANQMDDEAKTMLLQSIAEIGRSRDVFHIYNNIEDGNLHLDFFIDGNVSLNTVAETEGHGRWFNWLWK